MSIGLAEEAPVFDLQLTAEIKKALTSKYGDPIPDYLHQIISGELAYIKQTEASIEFLTIADIVKTVDTLGYPHRVRGALPSVFAGYLLGISETNPLPAHYYCPNCKHIEFTGEECSGYDLNARHGARKCPLCGTEMQGDGQQLYPEMFFGLEGEKGLSFELDLPKEALPAAINRLYELFDGNVLKGERENHYYYPSTGEGKAFIAEAKGKNPAYVLAPDVCDHRAHRLREIILTENRMLTVLKDMMDRTGLPVGNIQLDKIDYKDLFDPASFLEFDDSNSREMNIIRYIKPGSFSEYLSVQGLAHGTGVWDETASLPVETLKTGNTGHKLSVFREDIYECLLSHGYEKKEAFRVADMIGRGRGNRLSAEDISFMRRKGLDDTYISFVKEIDYLFPRAHAAEYAIQMLRLVEYKKYYS